MRTSLSLLLFVLFTGLASAQVVSTAEHKILYQLTEGDQEAHKKFIRQLNNVLTAAPNAKIEVVSHGMGIDLLRKTDNPFETDLQKLVDKGVVFVICENTLKQREMKKEQFLPLAGFVPAAILELVMKQEAGWIYIKAGG
jgi:intracellular sulfur oxidation DsrE/DsrF family protein